MFIWWFVVLHALFAAAILRVLFGLSWKDSLIWGVGIEVVIQLINYMVR